MDIEEKITQLRILTESDEHESVLLSYLADAKHIIMNRLYPYSADDEYSKLKFPEKYDWKQIRIAAWAMNKRGAEGQVQHIENGIHRNYKYADVPLELLYDVLPFVGIPR